MARPGPPRFRGHHRGRRPRGGRRLRDQSHAARPARAGGPGRLPPGRPGRPRAQRARPPHPPSRRAGAPPLQ
ncbi:hypothetical protein F3K39_20750 [Streptomyces sp. LBUM 1479]|nr:hypothetical protein [Streptomyces sp. LBUM 1479]